MLHRAAALILASSIVALAPGLAAAQAPGAGDVVLEPPGGAYVPPPGTPLEGPPLRLQLTLSTDDAALLRRGEISLGRTIAGGIVGTAYGFGIGHGLQGRWRESGWIFTTGEAIALTALVYGFVKCSDAERTSEIEHRITSCSTAPIIAGYVGFLGFRIWEIVDVWAGPSRHNRRVRALRNRISVFAAPTGRGSAAGGLALRF